MWVVDDTGRTGARVRQRSRATTITKTVSFIPHAGHTYHLGVQLAPDHASTPPFMLEMASTATTP